MTGSPINTDRIPKAFVVWFEELEKKYPYVTMEIGRKEILVCRVRIPIKSVWEIEGLAYGKLITDSSGKILERTFRPRYHAAEDVIKCMT